MALSKLSGDEQGVILGQLRNALEPRLVMYFSSANKELRVLPPPARRQLSCSRRPRRSASRWACGTAEPRGDQGQWYYLLCSRPGDAGSAGSVLPALESLNLIETQT